MSKNITIQEGGSAVQLTADKLKTDQVGGGHVLWVPEDEVSLGTKHITENGTYEAADDDKYGYSVVYVNVPGGTGGQPGGPGSSIVGTDPEDGEEYVWTVDENGEVTQKMMPSGIQITTLPSDLDYTDGETIDFTGIVVKLKRHDGTVYTDENYPDGVIPFSELTFPVTVADYDGSFPSGTYTTYPHVTRVGLTIQSAYNHFIATDDNCRAVGLSHSDGNGSSSIWWCIFTTDPTSQYFNAANHGSAGDHSYVNYPENPTYAPNNRFYKSINGVTYYAAYGGITAYDDTIGISHIPQATWPETIPEIVELAFQYAYGPGASEYGNQTIPVQWIPPASKFPSQKTRSTTYQITVTAASGSGGTTVDNEGFPGTRETFKGVSV